MGSSQRIRPWPALWSLVIGFFLVIVDTNIVAVANPIIMVDFDASLTATLWATSAYLLCFAAPLLVTGKLGDRFGQRTLFLAGLSVFVVSSAVCGAAPDIAWFIAARAAQGLGAAMLTPQTMAIISRIFAPAERGPALALWSVTAGVGMLVGPIAGGLLLDSVGWHWIFFLNIPLGVLGLVCGAIFIPRLSVSERAIDWVGAVLSAAGLLCVILGVQEGPGASWGPVVGPVTAWQLLLLGAVLLAVFVWWQMRLGARSLLPLHLFRDRNFSLGTATVVTVGFAASAVAIPLMFYYQTVAGMSPTEAALMMLPMAVLAIATAQPVGRLIDRVDARKLVWLGCGLQAAGMLGYAVVMLLQAPVAWMLLPSAGLGLANSLMWSPLLSITMFRVPPHQAGAGSGFYNACRQLGAVGSAAAVAATMQALTGAQLGGETGVGVSAVADAAVALPVALGLTMLLPVLVIVCGWVLSLRFAPRPASESVVTAPQR